MNWLAVNDPGRAGGVRGTVAVGMGVSVGRGVVVGCSCAIAVPKASVNATLRSGVGAGVDGVQAVTITASKMRLEKRRVNFCMDRILSEKL